MRPPPSLSCRMADVVYRALAAPRTRTRIAAFSSGGSSRQRPISAIVRWQPRHVCLIGSRRHTPTHGDGIAPLAQEGQRQPASSPWASARSVTPEATRSKKHQHVALPAAMAHSFLPPHTGHTRAWLPVKESRDALMPSFEPRVDHARAIPAFRGSVNDDQSTTPAGNGGFPGPVPAYRKVCIERVLHQLALLLRRPPRRSGVSGRSFGLANGFDATKAAGGRQRRPIESGRCATDSLIRIRRRGVAAMRIAARLHVVPFSASGLGDGGAVAYRMR